jgi:uncharacterized protein
VDVGVIRADERSAAFFEAAARDVLLIKRCADCGRWLDPGATGCTGCGEADPPWEPAAGRGTLISWAVLHAATPGAAEATPAAAEATAADAGDDPDAAASVLALVELDEGPWLRTRLDGTGGSGPDGAAADGAGAAGPAGPRAGLRVVVRFVHPAEGESYPVFRPEV